MSNALNSLKHIVVLMMENRSFDHMLGSLKQVNAEIDGATAAETNPDTNNTPVPVTFDANYQGDLEADPGHHFADVNTQLFNGATGGGVPNMQGFVKAYQNKTGDVPRSHNIMKCFPPEALPVLTTLAKEYVVFDRWFSSIPGPTLCNRAFAHFGTSFGHTDMTLNYVGKKSIYERMDNEGKSAKLYYYDASSSTLGLTFILKDQPKLFGTFDQFVHDCKSGQLPQYSFLEPNYKDGDDLANDQHPDNDVRAGDDFIGTVYNLLRTSPAWESTALLIVYDEHGGLYDHVPPPSLAVPDPYPDTLNGFKFDRLGVRVPAILVSAWAPAGKVIHDVYEHASIPATVTKVFIPATTAERTDREKASLTFETVLSLDQARKDAFLFGAANRNSPHASARANITIIPVNQPAPAPDPDRPVSGLLEEHIEHIHAAELELPPAMQTGEDITKIRTMGEAGAYIERVTNILKNRAAAGGAH